MEESKIEITQAELDILNNNHAKYLAVLAKSRKFKKDNLEYTVNYNRDYFARRMLEPDFKKKHSEAVAKSAKKRRELNKLENPPPIRHKTKKHIFESDENGIKTYPDNVV